MEGFLGSAVLGDTIRAIPRDSFRTRAADAHANAILAALPPEDYERLLPHLAPVPLPAGWVVHGPGDREDFVYFITAGIVSRLYLTASGGSAELAMTGSEGVIGVTSVLGGKSTLSEAVVVSAGHAYRMRADKLQDECGRNDALLALLLRYTQALIAQTGQIAVCVRHHSLKQQLCRWILTCLDRSPANELRMTHELIGRMLGVRREGVSEAAGKLQSLGLIRCDRGRIVVLDRPRLEAKACECYAVIKHEYDRLLCSSTTMRNAGVHRAYGEYRTTPLRACA